MIQSLLKRLSELPPEWKFLLFLTAGLYILAVATIRIDVSDPEIPDWQEAVRPGFPDGDVLTSATLVGDWTVDARVYRAESREARLQFSAAEGPWVSLRVLINGHPSQRWLLRVRRGFTSYTLPAVVPGEEVRIDPEKFGGLLDTTEPIRFELSPAVDFTGRATITRVAVRGSAVLERDLPASLPAMLMGPLLPIAIALFMSRAGRRSFRMASVIGGIAGTLLLVFSIQDPALLVYTWVGATALLLGVAAATFFRGLLDAEADPALRGRMLLFAEWAALGAIMGFAVWTRWNAYGEQRFLALLPDAMGYLEAALTGGFYETAQSHAPYIREPLFPAILGGWMQMAPGTGNHARILSLLIGIVPVLLCHLAGRRLFGPVVGLLSAMVLAMHPEMARLSVEVLRDDLLTALFLALMLGMMLLRDAPWWRAGVFGVGWAALTLTRLGFGPVLLPILAVMAWRGRWKWGEIVLAVVLAVPPSIPHLVYNARMGEGDLFFSSNVHLRYYVNADHVGEPGFPSTSAEWAADPYAGEALKSSDLLRLYGPAGMAFRVLRGYISVFVFEFPYGFLFQGRKWMMLFGLAGLFALWRRRESWWWLWWFPMAMLPVAFAAGIRLDARLALPAAPGILWVWALGVQQTAVWARMLLVGYMRKAGPET